MRRPGRPTLARLIAIVVVLAAACGDQRLSTPTSPSVPTGGFARVETDEGLATAGPQDAGPLASLSIDPSVFKGGESTRGTVTLTAPAPAGGTTITVTADDTAATVPASITIAEGGTSGTFRITTKTVTADVRIRITASADGGSLTALMRITPENAVASLTIDPMRITAGKTATGTVTLASTAPTGGTVVTLQSAIIDAQVPSSITIAAGGKTGTFTVETRDVSKDTEVWITASIGRDYREVQIRIVPARPTSSGSNLTVGGRID